MSSRFNQILPNEQYVSSRVPLPFEEMVKLGALKQGRQDEAIAEKEQYLAKNWNRLGADAEHARSLKKESDQVLYNFKDKDFNDPQVRSDWYSAKVNLANKWGPDGAVGAMENNFNLRQAKVKELDTMLGKKPEEGGITKDTYDYILKKADDEYAAKGGIGEKGPQGYQQINFETPALNPDIDKQVIEASKDWKANAESHGYWQTPDGQWARKNEHGIEYIDPQEVHDSVLADIKARPENQAYAKQQAEIATYGKDTSTDGYSSFRPGYIKQQIYDNIFEQPAKLAAARLGFTKQTQDQDVRENSVFVHKANQKTDNPTPITLHNDSVVTPGKTTDYNKLSTNIASIGEQLKALPKEGSINDNYQTKAARADLNKRLTVSTNYLKAATDKYFSTPKGVEELKEQYKKGINDSGVIGEGSNIQHILNDPEIKKYIKNADDYASFMSGHLDIPQDVLDKKFTEILPSLGGSGAVSSTNTLKGILSSNLMNSVNKYIADNPISYSAQALTSPDLSDKRHSAVADINKGLTTRVNDNGTNYLTADGIDLNSWKSKNLEQGDKIDVAVMDKPIEGQYAHYMTVRDKEGKIKIEMPIYPKSGGREEMGDTGQKLMEENSSKETALEKDNYTRGLKMVAQAQYGDQLSDEYLQSYEKRLRNNSGVAINTPKTTIDTPVGPIEAYTKIVEKNGIVYYQLIGGNGKPINKEPVKSVDDLRISLLDIK